MRGRGGFQNVRNKHLPPLPKKKIKNHVSTMCLYESADTDKDSCQGVKAGRNRIHLGCFRHGPA